MLGCSCACPDDPASRNAIAEAGGYSMLQDIERDEPGFMDLFQSADQRSYQSLK